MIPWIPIIKGEPKPIIELPYRGEDPKDVYAQRYVEDYHEDLTFRSNLYYDEAIGDFNSEGSLLLFGSGHSHFPNTIAEKRSGKISAMDYVKEAGYKLNKDIKFHHKDILISGITQEFDYIFSAHTIEHFTRKQLFDVILPECLSHAKKAVVFLVPYEEHWATEPSHKCLFYIGDELFMRSNKYKIIRNGSELILWFDV